MCLILLAALLPFAGCNKVEVYDIRGDWVFSHAGEVGPPLRFEGSLESGAVQWIGREAVHGSYAVTGKDVIFNYEYPLDYYSWNCRFVGTFESDDAMTGTMEFIAPFQPYNWSYEAEGMRL
jgi:hypothetical protein